MNVDLSFSDINECYPDPCNFLFQCEDLINEYHCDLIEWKVALIIGILLIIILMIIFFVIFLWKRTEYNDVDHNW